MKEKIKLSRTVLVSGIICLLIVGLVSGIVAGYFLNKNSNKTKTSDKINSTDDGFKASDCIDIGDYRGLTVNIGVSKSDIKSETDTLIEDNTTYKKKYGKIKDGDKVYADFKGYVNGKKMDSTCGSDYIEIGSGDWLKGFEESIKGRKTGKMIKFTCNVPEGTYDDKDIDGKKVEFRVKVLYICGKEIKPVYNDKFVNKISSGKYKTVKEYNEYIKEKLLAENENDKGDYAWTDVLELCKVKKYPDDMLVSAEKETLQGYYDMAELYGCSVDEVLKEYGYNSLEEFKKYDLKELAQDTVKEKLAAMAIAEKEKITYDKKEYESVLDEEFGYNSEKYATKKDYEKENKQYLTDTVTLKVVKQWLAKNLKFDSSKA